MYDLKLDTEGDISISKYGDISLIDSTRQEILIRLRWIFGEWRLGPELGFAWFEEVLVRNPNIGNIKQLIREEILQVEGVTDAKVTEVKYDERTRKAMFRFVYSVDKGTFNEEVTVNV